MITLQALSGSKRVFDLKFWFGHFDQKLYHVQIKFVDKEKLSYNMCFFKAVFHLFDQKLTEEVLLTVPALLFTPN